VHAWVRRAAIRTEGGHSRPTLKLLSLVTVDRTRAWALVDCGPLLREHWPFAHHRSAHASADLGRVHVQLCESPAQSVAMHAEFCGGLALVAAMVREDLKDIALFELPNRVRVGDSGGVHLSDQGVQFALQGGYLTY